ncbi:unnamed protein product, partial [Polarella glacialis]
PGVPQGGPPGSVPPGLASSLLVQLQASPTLPGAPGLGGALPGLPPGLDLSKLGNLGPHFSSLLAHRAAGADPGGSLPTEDGHGLHMLGVPPGLAAPQ